MRFRCRFFYATLLILPPYADAFDDTPLLPRHFHFLSQLMRYFALLSPLRWPPPLPMPPIEMMTSLRALFTRRVLLL